MNSAIVQTKVLTDPAELERILQSGLQAASGMHSAQGSANGYSFDPPSGFGAENYQVYIVNDGLKYFNIILNTIFSITKTLYSVQ